MLCQNVNLSNNRESSLLRAVDYFSKTKFSSLHEKYKLFESLLNTILNIQMYFQWHSMQIQSGSLKAERM